jgi:ribosomal protein L37AE/L43A
MVTKLVRCPFCKRLTFVRFEREKWVTCRKVIDEKKDPYFTRYTSLYPAKVDKSLFIEGCGRKFIISSSGEVV